MPSKRSRDSQRYRIRLIGHLSRQFFEEMYDNKSEKGGRPNCDVIMMFKILGNGCKSWKMPLESNGVGINSRRVHAESVVSAFQHPTYTTRF